MTLKLNKEQIKTFLVDIQERLLAVDIMAAKNPIPEQLLSDAYSGYVSGKRFERAVQYDSKSSHSNSIFFLPPDGIGAASYVNFSRELSDIANCYLLENIEYASGEKWEFDSLCDYYLLQIQEIQKTGPYCILGLSKGAHLAHTIAKKLEKEISNKNNLIVMLDPFYVHIIHLIVDDSGQVLKDINHKCVNYFEYLSSLEKSPCTARVLIFEATIVSPDGGESRINALIESDFPVIKSKAYSNLFMNWSSKKVSARHRELAKSEAAIAISNIVKTEYLRWLEKNSIERGEL